MTDDQTLANLLYGGATAPAPAPAPAAAPAPFDADAAAAALYIDGTDNLDEVTGLDRIHASTQRDIESAFVERLGGDPSEGRAVAGEWADTFRQYQLPPDEAAQLTGIGLGVIAGGVEADPIAWRASARTALMQEFGTSADAALADAQRLVAKDAKLARFLDETGLCDHPAYVKAIALRAKALRAAKKL